jgi:voltage-gated potassium channel
MRLFRRSGPWLTVIFFFIAVIAFSSFVVYALEQHRGDGFESYFDSLWWTVVTVSTVGYGDVVPRTIIGRLVAMTTMLIGIGLMGVVTGRVASFLMERQMKAEKGLLSHSSTRGHFIICGWKQEMTEVLDSILASNPDVGPDQVVLINRAPQEEVDPVRTDPRFEGIRIVHGDLMEERDLIRAGIKGAARVLVLADYLTPGNLQQLDSKTVMAVMTIKNLNRRAYVCAELLDTKFEKYLQLSHCEEILLSRDFSRSMLASASSGTGLAHVVQALLDKDLGGHLKTVGIPESLVGKSYGELRAHMAKQEDCVLIGLLENTGNINSRKREALTEAQKNRDINSLVPRLRAIKNLAGNKPVINPASDYPIGRYARGIVVDGSTQDRSEEDADE